MARLPYPSPSYVSGVMHQFPERLHRTNIGRMLSYAPTTLSPYYTFSFALLDQLELDPKLRQLTILRVAHRTEEHYAWVQHVALARLVGVSDEQITALQQGEVEGEHSEAMPQKEGQLAWRQALWTLKTRLQGELVLSGDDDFEAARSVWNGAIDCHPALIVRCVDAADVMTAITFAREHSLVVSVRSGGHSIVGHSTNEGGW